MLELAPDMRIATITGWLADLDRQLALARFGSNPIAVNIRHQMHEFTEGALPRSPIGRAG